MDGMPNFDEAKACLRKTISRDDFYAHMVSHKYIYAPARTLWPAASVNARLPIGDDYRCQRATSPQR